MALNIRPQTNLKRSISTPGTVLSNWRTIHSYNSNDLDRIDGKFGLLSVSSVSPDVRLKSIDYHNSPPVNSVRFDFGENSNRYDDITDVLRVCADDLSSQMTLIDLSIFVSIQPQELLSCGWSGSKKLQLSPNVVAFTQRFNRVSFWVVQEILSHKSVKHRAEVLSHFIKVAKRLYELNNLHSAYAVKSALTSAPIHRLTKTWAYLSKKDKTSFERLNELFSDSDNFEKLREHLSNAKTPCIPYLGMYLHDIVYIDVAHPLTRGLENPQRRIKFDNILRIISEFQRSNYEYLPVIPNVQNYLLSVRYIEELQKFLEDDNYKLSLKLEPPESDTKSVFYVRENSQTVRSANESNVNESLSSSPSITHLSVNYFPESQSHANSMPGFSKKVNFIPSHRKAHSLGTNVLSSMTSTQSSTTPLNINRCLIDDSLINEDQVISCDSMFPSKPTFEIIYDEEEVEVEVEEQKPLNRYIEFNPLVIKDKILFQGLVKRKTIMKDGKKPSVSYLRFCSLISAWVRYWLVLQGTHLVYYDSKSVKNYQRIDYRSNPCKWVSLRGWVVALVEESSQSSDTFTLSDSAGRNVYKFRALTHNQAYEWCKRIGQVLSQFKSSRSSLIECLIDFDEDINNKMLFPIS